MEENKIKMGTVVGITVLVLGLLLLIATIKVVPAGYARVVLRLGKVDRVMHPGFNMQIPLFEKSVKFDVRTQKEEVGASSASKDLQTVSTVVALNFNLDENSLGSLYSQIGKEYKARIIDPAIQESVKAATAKYTAEELITKRELVKDAIKQSLFERLAGEYISVTELSIVDFDFSDSFNSAIEAKVTAEQNALAAKNKLEQVKFEAEQRIASAKAEAEAIRIQAQAIQTQGGAEYVNLKAIEKWNGTLPQYMLGNTVPFVNIGQ